MPSKFLPVDPSRLSVENPVYIEIMDAADPPVAYWITEAQNQLAGEGGLKT